MTSQEFNTLKYGNVISEQATGRRLLVLHVKKDASGNTTEVGVIDSLPLTSASSLDILDATAEETIVVNGILQSKTV
jgi:hypothetical protein